MDKLRGTHRLDLLRRHEMKSKLIMIMIVSIVILTLANHVAAIGDSEAEDLFSRAETMATWFTLFTPHTGDGDPLKLRYGGKEIYLNGENIETSDNGDSLPYVLVENYKNTDELEKDLETVFSHDIAERLINARYDERGAGYTHFVEYDGALYFKAWAYANNYGTRPELKFERISDGDEKTVFRASYIDVNGESRTYDYAIGTENGRRVFTSFELPQYLYYKDVLNGEIASPMTADAPVITVCALALSALAAAVVLRKKR